MLKFITPVNYRVLHCLIVSSVLFKTSAYAVTVFKFSTAAKLERSHHAATHDSCLSYARTYFHYDDGLQCFQTVAFELLFLTISFIKQ